MKPISAISPGQVQGIRYVLCDIDDTLTREGYLLPDAFDALWRLHRRGYTVIPVTGRPAGWCDMIIRQWPVAAVIGENGAFALYRTAAGFEERVHPAVASGEVHQRLSEIESYVCAAIPGMKTAKDQPYRRYDIAFDFAEDPPFFTMQTAQRVKKLCEVKRCCSKNQLHSRKRLVRRI